MLIGLLFFSAKGEDTDKKKKKRKTPQELRTIKSTTKPQTHFIPTAVSKSVNKVENIGV